MRDTGQVDVQIAPRFADKVDEDLLRRVANKVLRHEKVEGEIALSVVITDDESVRELNRQFRGVDAPADVLAFDSGEESDFVTAPGEPTYLGDVVISYPRAVAQAEEYGHSIDRELALLAVHGVLHLVGYDHVDEADRTEMWARQYEILESLVQAKSQLRPSATCIIFISICLGLGKGGGGHFLRQVLVS